MAASSSICASLDHPCTPGSADVRARSGIKVAKAGLVDILERPLAPLLDVPELAQLEPGQSGLVSALGSQGQEGDDEGQKILLHLKPFEVKTVKLVLPTDEERDHWVAV